MKIKQLISGMFLAGTVFTMSGQNVSSTATLTSGGLNAGTQGNGNTFYGYEAGKSTTNGTFRYNTFIGHQSGLQNTSGQYNVFIGNASGSTNKTASGNVYIGHEAGRSNEGYQNVIIGAAACYDGNGNNNIYLGYFSGGESFGSSNIFIGNNSGFSNTGAGNLFLGQSAGINNTGNDNLFFGNNSGFSNISGGGNLFAGVNSGYTNTTGWGNVFLGKNAGTNNDIGHENVIIGNNAGDALDGSYNVFIGSQSGAVENSGNNNTFIGYKSGMDSTGSNNIFIGKQSGSGTIDNNLLYIENSGSATPLIWGDFAADLLKFNAKVGIGGITSFPTMAGLVNVSNYKLFVKGGILAEEVRVSLNTSWADYVFADDYNLRPLEEVECFIAENGHLPNVPSAKQIADEGIELGDIARIQQEKIEELTLYAIQQQKQLDKQDAEIRDLKAMVQALIEKN